VVLPNGHGLTVWQFGTRTSFDVNCYGIPPAACRESGRQVAGVSERRAISDCGLMRIVARAGAGSAFPSRPRGSASILLRKHYGSGSSDGTLTRWRLPNGGQVQPVLRAQRAVSDMTFDAKGSCWH